MEVNYVLGLGFLIIRDVQDQISSYNIFIINNSEHTLTLDISVTTQFDKFPPEPVTIEPFQKKFYADIPLDYLNEKPKFHLSIPYPNRIQPIIKTLKLKSEFVLREGEQNSELGGELITIPLVSYKDLDFEIQKDQLKSALQPIKKISTQKSHFNPIDLKASLPDYIDIHFENIYQGNDRLSNYEMLTIQLDACVKYLDQAIMAGLSTVYIVHGVGEGKLRKEVAHLLRADDRVRKFIAEYNSRFGHGSTKVELF